jgi:hypothetical protein
VIDLPDGAAAQDTIAYTGGYGSRSRTPARRSTNGNVVLFETTGPLGPREGLTVAVKFQKGIIASDHQQLALWYLRDNAGTISPSAASAWSYSTICGPGSRVGRDPPRGVVVPRWDLPEGVSPALTHYIWNKGLKRQAFPAISAAAINLAVEGYLELEDIGDTITLERTERPVEGVKFPVGERALLDKIEGLGGKLVIDKSNGTKVQSLASRFRSAMESEHRSVFYKGNIGWIVPGRADLDRRDHRDLVFGQLSDATLGFSIPAIFVGIVMTVMIVGIAKRASAGLGGKIQLAFFMVAGAIFLLNSGIFTAANLFDAVDEPLVIGGLARS